MFVYITTFVKSLFQSTVPLGKAIAQIHTAVPSAFMIPNSVAPIQTVLPWRNVATLNVTKFAEAPYHNQVFCLLLCNLNLNGAALATEKNAYLFHFLYIIDTKKLFYNIWQFPDNHKYLFAYMQFVIHNGAIESFLLYNRFCIVLTTNFLSHCHLSHTSLSLTYLAPCRVPL